MGERSMTKSVDTVRELNASDPVQPEPLPIWWQEFLAECENPPRA
jgi:hypothetical protein